MFHVKDNVISEFFVNGKNIIRPWGIETADMNSFFSLQDGFGYRYTVVETKNEVTDMSYLYSAEIKMKHGHWKLDGNDVCNSEGTEVLRTASVICMEESYFMDFVTRYRFKKDAFDYAVIDGKKIEFRGTDKYYQYETDHVDLVNKYYRVRITLIDAVTAGAFVPVMYVRDSSYDGWVVHVRMIPRRVDLEVIKLCNKYCQTRPLPQWISKQLLKNEAIRQSLMYAGEKKVHKGRLMRIINPNAFPMVCLKSGEQLVLKSKLSVLFNKGKKI